MPVATAPAIDPAPRALASTGDESQLTACSGNFEAVTLGPLDMLIAAHVLSLGATLVTNNDKEFRRAPGLRCENWA